jgi:hypothetical protein
MASWKKTFRFIPASPLHRRFMNLSLQAMNRAARYFQLLVIVRGYGRIAFSFERFDAQLSRRFIDAHNLVVLVHIDVEGFAERYDQMLFVQLGVALDRFVLDIFGDVAQFGQGFVFQFMVCVCHRLSVTFIKISQALWYKSASEISRRGAPCRVQPQTEPEKLSSA